MSADTGLPAWLRTFQSWLGRPAVALSLGIGSAAVLAVWLIIRFAASDVVAGAASAGIDPRALSLGAGLAALSGLGAHAGAVAPRAVRVGAVLGAAGLFGTVIWYVVALIAALVR